jgi:hypothetical protein
LEPDGGQVILEPQSWLLLTIILGKVTRELESLGHSGLTDATAEAPCTARLDFVIIVGFVIFRV